MSFPNGFSLKELPEFFIRFSRKYRYHRIFANLFSVFHKHAKFSMLNMSNRYPHLNNLSCSRIKKYLLKKNFLIIEEFNRGIISGFIERWVPIIDTIPIRKLEILFEDKIPILLAENFFFLCEKR